MAWTASRADSKFAWSNRWFTDGKKALSESIIDQRNKILDLLSGAESANDKYKVCRVRSLLEEIRAEDNGATVAIAIFVKYFQNLKFTTYANKVESYAYKLERSVGEQDIKHQVESLIQKRMPVYFEDDEGVRQ